ncbi:serine racemase isoform X2 [Mauremys reevesii]|uniref:serine racemase isoform X2 n=1 Tax=Mauremys reevesii TaxID=260615 RepID=UPI00193F3C98|nr:serine racemase isoform X2 [Mauremys reevesii]
MSSPYCISLADVEAAQSSLHGLIHLTPILTSSSLDELAGHRLFFKCELFQKTGSFKIRGALNAVRSLVRAAQGDREQPKAVVTHSSGNHGQALAFAAKVEGIPAYVVVPRTAPLCKKAAICSYGARLILCEPTDKSRMEVAARTVQEKEGVMVHPNQDPAVIAGQGTIALEVLQQALRPDVRVYAAEPCNADDCYRSKVTGELTPNRHLPDTIADSVKTSIGPNTWPIIKDLVDDVLTVTEEEIQQATQLVWERMKLLIEPTAGVGVAAVLSEQFRSVSQEVKNVCIVLCGGNIDLGSLAWLSPPGKGANGN